MKASKIKGSKLRKFEGSEVLGRAVLRMVCENNLHVNEKQGWRNEKTGLITFKTKHYDAFIKIIEEEIDEALAQAQKQAAHTAFRVF